MTIAEFLLIIIVLAIIIFVLYYYFKGSSGRLAVSRPIESRVDEYLDQRFESLMSEWSLATRSSVQRFRDEKSPVLAEDEAKMAQLKNFESEMTVTLATLEERLDALEAELEKKGESKPGNQ